MSKPKVSTFLWYHDRAEEAANFYHAIFPDSVITDIRRWGKGSPAPEGSVLAATIQIADHELILFNGGPHQTLSNAVSIFIRVKTQEELDRYWNGLTADGGKPIQGGWLQDKFGLSWQIVPDGLVELISDQEHPEKAARAMKAMMSMVKFDIKALQDAYNSGS